MNCMLLSPPPLSSEPDTPQNLERAPIQKSTDIKQDQKYPQERTEENRRMILGNRLNKSTYH